MGQSSVVHDFTERLQFSAKLSDEPSWVEFYQRLWPDMLAAVRLDKDSKFQRWGLDRVVYLPSGRELWIDEKKRQPDKHGRSYDDFLLEEYSVLSSKKTGWTLDETKRCDLIAYAIPALQKCYLLPFELLRLTCKHNINEWKTLKQDNGHPCYPKDALNNGYVTRNCVVSWNRLFLAMRQQMHRRFGGELCLPLPEPEVTGEQLNFWWKAAIECE